MLNKQTNKHIPCLIISLTVKLEVTEELTMICFVHFMWASAMIWLLMKTFWVHCRHTIPRSYCETKVCAQHVCVCIAYCRQGGDTQRLPSSASDTCVWPARHVAVFAEALVWTGGVHTASVLAWTDTSSWFCTLINVWKRNYQWLWAVKKNNSANFIVTKYPY